MARPGLRQSGRNRLLARKVQVGDAIEDAEQDGQEWLGRKQAIINARRITKLWNAKNAAIAAQVDALPDEG